jgi:hypothetical protein
MNPDHIQLRAAVGFPHPASYTFTILASPWNPSAPLPEEELKAIQTTA